MLLWPVFVAFHAPLTGVDPFVLTFAIGGLTGLVGGLLLMWRSRR